MFDTKRIMYIRQSYYVKIDFNEIVCKTLFKIYGRRNSKLFTNCHALWDTLYNLKYLQLDLSYPTTPCQVCDKSSQFNKFHGVSKIFEIGINKLSEIGINKISEIGINKIFEIGINRIFEIGI